MTIKGRYPLYSLGAYVFFTIAKNGALWGEIFFVSGKKSLPFTDKGSGVIRVQRAMFHKEVNEDEVELLMEAIVESALPEEAVGSGGRSYDLLVH